MIKKIVLLKWLWPFNKNPAKISRKAGISIDAKWQEDYLVKKIQDRHPQIHEQLIRCAVKDCSFLFKVPEAGEKIMECVLNKLQQNIIDSKEYTKKCDAGEG